MANVNEAAPARCLNLGINNPLPTLSFPDSETKETLAKSKDLPSNKYTLELNSSWISIFLVT